MPDQEINSQNIYSSSQPPATEPQSSAEIIPSSKSKVLKIVIIIAFLASVVGVGAFVALRYFGQSAQNTKVASNSNTESSITPQISPTTALVSPTTEPVDTFAESFSYTGDTTAGTVESIPNANFKTISPEEASSKIKLTVFENIGNNSFETRNVSDNDDTNIPTVPLEEMKIINSRSADGSLWKNTENFSMPQGFEAKIYEYPSGGSSVGLIINIFKNKEKYATFYPISYSFTKDGRKLFIADGRKRIIDIEKNTAINISDTTCKNGQPNWHGNRLTTSHAESLYAPYNSEVCVFDDNGNLIAKIEANLATNLSILETYGLLPNDNNIFYVYTVSKTQENNTSTMMTCSLYILDITNKDRDVKYVDLVNVKDEIPYVCTSGYVGLKLEDLTYDGGRLAHRRIFDGTPSKPKEYSPWVIVENK